MTITFNITSTTNMGGGMGVLVSVDNLCAQSVEMPFAKGLVEAVEKFAMDYGKEPAK